MTAALAAVPDFTLCKPEGLCYSRTLARAALVPGSSAVEQPAVNRLVAGSNPARGAKQNKHLAGYKLTPCVYRVRSGYNASPGADDATL